MSVLHSGTTSSQLAFRSFSNFYFWQFQLWKTLRCSLLCHQTHILLQNELSSKTELFPAKGRLDETLKKPIADYLFAGATLAAEPQGFTTTLAFEIDGLSLGLPFLT